MKNQSKNVKKIERVTILGLLLIVAVFILGLVLKTGFTKKYPDINKDYYSTGSEGLLLPHESSEAKIIPAGPKGYVMLYSSMKEAQLSALKTGFTKKYPDINMDYYSTGSGGIMAKLSAEEQAGNIKADVIWIGEPIYYYILKEKGLLMPYESPEAEIIPAGLKDKDNYFCAARIVTLGLVYNVNNVKGNDIPKDWNDLLKPRFKNNVVMADPTFSGTTLYTVAALIQNPKYGWDFFRELKANGIKVENESSAVVDKVGAGEYDVGIGVNYIARTKKEKSSPVDFIYPESGISTVPSPIAIFKSTGNIKAATKLYDYIISIEGQLILMKENVIPVRPEVKLDGSITIREIVKRALYVNHQKLVIEKGQMLSKFNEIIEE